MNEFYWGGAFDISLFDQDNSTAEKRLGLLDKICNIENLKALGTGWNQLTYNQAKDLLTKALTYDLVYSSSTIAPSDKVDLFKSEILRDVDDPMMVDNPMMYCYTNWLGSPWDSAEGGSWNPLTKHTFI